MSTLHVENLKGLSSGGNANKVIIPTGQALEVTDNIRYDDMPAGSVIQVVTNTVTSVIVQNSTSWTTMFSATITPKFNDSKIFIQVMIGGLYMNLGANVNQSSWRICRNSGTSITNANTHFHTEVGRNQTGAGTRAFPNMSIVDSPATTSSTTYNVQSERHTGSGGIQINDTFGTSTITLLEIKQ